MLVSLYQHAGAVAPGLAWYRVLDIKHIQAETLAHHVLPALLATAQRDPAAGLLRELAVFHDNHLRDGADMTLTAYRHGTFSKVREFVRFKERLERSHQRLAARVESLLLRLAEAADSPTEAQVRRGRKRGCSVGSSARSPALHGGLLVLLCNTGTRRQPLPTSSTGLFVIRQW